MSLSSVFMIPLLFMGILLSSKSAMLFLLSLEGLMIFFAFICYFSTKMFFIFLLIVGVLEALLGLSLLLFFIRNFGSDYIFFL